MTPKSVDIKAGDVVRLTDRSSDGAIFSMRQGGVGVGPVSFRMRSGDVALVSEAVLPSDDLGSQLLCLYVGGVYGWRRWLVGGNHRELEIVTKTVQTAV